MRKTAVTLTVSTLILGVFGAFLRWLQNTNAFEGVNGLLIPGNTITVVFLCYCVLAAAVMVAAALGWFRKYGCPKDAAALQSRTAIPAVIGWVGCVLFLLASVVIMFTAYASLYPMFLRLLGAFGILAGLCFPFLMGKKVVTSSVSRPASAVSMLFYCFWLVCSYRTNANNPVVWAFAVEILAIASAAVAFYYIAAFHYGAGKGTRAFLSVLFAVFFNVCTLFDNHGVPVLILCGVTVAMLLTAEFLLIANLTDDREV